MGILAAQIRVALKPDRVLARQAIGVRGVKAVDHFQARLDLTDGRISLDTERLLDAYRAALSYAAEPAIASLRSRTVFMAREDDVLYGSLDGPVEIVEEGLRFAIDVANGPKTGFFIDQRPNRLALRMFASGRRVLDPFCADGGFGLHAALAGAAHVDLADVSSQAVERARHNAAANNLTNVTFETHDALDWLGTLVDAGSTYDLIVLDPPAFAKSRRNVEDATRAYQRLNINALQLLPVGGILATSSCSQAISEDEFLKIISYSARKVGCGLRLLYRGTAGPDHPTMASMPETDYLKFFVFQRMGDECP